MKKIFAILLSLALLVSLGVVTAAPVGAVVQPSISPTSTTYNKDAPAQVETTITWGSATTVTQIEKTDGTVLTKGAVNDWVVYGNQLVITPAFLTSLVKAPELTYIGGSLTLVILFDVGICTLTITATGTSMSVSPSSATWVYGSSTAVTTTIIWGTATGPATLPGFVATDGEVLGDTVVIKAAYLNNPAKSGIMGIGDYKTVTIVAASGEMAFFTIVAVGPDPTISPTSANWILGSTSVVTTTITLNAATALTSVKEAGGVVLTAPPGGDYEIIGNLLVIKSSWLSANPNLASAGDTIALELIFDSGLFQCLLTITATGTNVPTISPTSAMYCVGACPSQNVSTIITWGCNATAVSSVVDVTSPVVPVTLTPGTDWWVSGNNTLWIAAGYPAGTGTAWGGLECNLDCYLRGARLLQVNFNGCCNAKAIFTVTTDASCCVAPGLSSTALTYDLDKALSSSCLFDASYAYVSAIVNFGSTTGIASVKDNSCAANPTCASVYMGFCPTCNCVLTGGDVYAGNDYYCAYYAPLASQVLFLYKATYLNPACSNTSAGAGLTECGDQVKVTIHWAPANPTCALLKSASYAERFAPTTLTVTAVGTPGSVSPSSAQFNIDSPSNVTAMIDWGPHATTITKITCGDCQAPPLVYGTDYTFDPRTLDPQTGCAEESCLYINEDWLTNKSGLRSDCLLEEAGDTILLNIEFDKCDDAKLTIKAVANPLCFIATAAGADAPQLDILREFRDKVLLPNALGAELVSLYYKTSPPIAELISQSEALRDAVKVGFIDRIVAILNWSHDKWS